MNQFFDETNADIGKRRFLDPAKITTKLKAEEEALEGDEPVEETKDSSSTAREEIKSTKTTAASAANSAA